MNKLIMVSLMSTLYACGTDSGSGGGDGQPETQVAKQDTGVATSYYVSSEKDLVACDGSRRGFLAYVKDTSLFKACLEAGWTTVDVKGKDGSNGSAGSTGASGTATMVSGNNWYDSITGKMWVMTNIASTTTGWTDAQTTCTGNYRQPTVTEAQAALTHGMAAMAQALSSPPVYIFTSNYVGSGFKVVRISDLAYMNSASGSASQFCIAQ